MACASAIAADAEQAVVLKQGPMALNLSGPDPQDLASGASLALSLPDATLKAQATASVGLEDGDPAYWHKNETRVEAQLSGPLGSALDVSGENALSLTYRPPESLGASAGTPHVVRVETQSAHAGLALDKGAVSLALSGDTTSQASEDTSGKSAANRSVVRTAAHAATAGMAWQPVGWLRIEGGSSARVSTISWQDTATRSSNFQSVDPHVAVTVTPLSGTVASARLVHTVAPYDAAAFANYSRADGQSDASGFKPDHAWQMEAKLQQKLGPASVSATYTASRQGTATEFAEVGGAQAPATTPLLSRDSVAFAVQIPLAELGLPRTNLTSEAQWQTSRVLDPVTQQDRAASGETPYRVSLSVSHALPAKHLSVGLNGGFSGASTAYQVSELSTTAPGGTVGAFVAYKPGNYEINLNVSGLLGSETSSGFYRGQRNEGEPVRTAVQDNSGPMLSLSLKKPL
jgi:hypothetical protein